MKVTECEILILPGFKGSGPFHWQTRWQARLSTARRVQLGDWHKPVFDEWRDNLVAAVDAAERPVVLIAHSVAAQLVVQSADRIAAKVSGALLVAPPEVDNPAIRPRHLLTFGPPRRDPLPFPSVVIASRDDPFCRFSKAGDMAADWGSLFMDAGTSGHLNAESGHGPWPEGLLVFAKFMAGLKPLR